MSAALDLLFTADQICEVARGNVTALCLVTTAFLKDKNESLSEFWYFTGLKFAQGWSRYNSARDFAEATALIMLSANCKLASISGGESKAEIVISGWPGQQELDFFDITQEEADYTVELFVTIGHELGFDCHWSREDQNLKLQVIREI